MTLYSIILAVSLLLKTQRDQIASTATPEALAGIDRLILEIESIPAETRTLLESAKVPVKLGI